MPNIVTTEYVKTFMDANSIQEMLVALSGTDVGISVFTIPNPGFTSFLRISSNNTASLLSASELLTALGATTVGTNLFQASNPGVVSYPQISSNNTVSFLTGPQMLTAIGAGESSVSSVGAFGPSSIMTWSTALTSAGTLTATLATQTANRVFAGPVSGADATPTFRALVYADLPNLSARRVTDDTIAEGNIQTNADNVGTDTTIRTTWSTASFTLSAPTNGAVGQRIRYHIAASGAIRTITLSTVYTPSGVVFAGAIASGYTRVLELEKNGTKWYMTKNLEFET